MWLFQHTTPAPYLQAFFRADVAAESAAEQKKPFAADGSIIEKRKIQNQPQWNEITISGNEMKKTGRFYGKSKIQPAATKFDLFSRLADFSFSRFSFISKNHCIIHKKGIK